MKYENERDRLHTAMKEFAQKELKTFHCHVNIIAPINDPEMANHLLQ